MRLGEPIVEFTRKDTGHLRHVPPGTLLHGRPMRDCKDMTNVEEMSLDRRILSAYRVLDMEIRQTPEVMVEFLLEVLELLSAFIAIAETPGDEHGHVMQVLSSEVDEEEDGDGKRILCLFPVGPDSLAWDQFYTHIHLDQPALAGYIPEGEGA